MSCAQNKVRPQFCASMRLPILAELAFSQGDIESAFRFAMKIGNTDWLVASLTTGVRCFVHGFVHPNWKHKMRLSFWTV